MGNPDRYGLMWKPTEYPMFTPGPLVVSYVSDGTVTRLMTADDIGLTDSED